MSYTKNIHYCDLSNLHINNFAFFIVMADALTQPAYILYQKYHAKKYLKLPNSKEYTGHALRRTSASLLADTGSEILTLKQQGG